MLSCRPPAGVCLSDCRWAPAVIPRRLPVTHADVKDQLPHQWWWAAHLSRYVCMKCGRWCRTARNTSCTVSRLGGPAIEVVASKVGEGHVMRLCSSRTVLSLNVCCKCGAYTQAVVRGLARPCRGRPPDHRVAFMLRRMEGGRHPLQEVCIGSSRSVAAVVEASAFVQSTVEAVVPPL